MARLEACSNSSSLKLSLNVKTKSISKLHWHIAYFDYSRNMNIENTAKYADLFAALGSEPRLKIMQLLFAAYPDGMVVSDIQAKLNIPNSTLSHHLEKLRTEGLVDFKKDKQYLWYSANAQTMEDLLAFLYTGRRNDYPIELANNKSNKEEFMFERFFGPIFVKLFGLINQGFPLPSFLTKFTDQAVTAILLAQTETRRLRHQYVGTEQILIGLIREGSGIASQLLTSVGANLENAQIEEEKIIGRGSSFFAATIPFTQKAKQVMEFSLEESQRLGLNSIGTEHLLLGLLQEPDSVGAKILGNLGVDLFSLEQRLRQALS